MKKGIRYNEILLNGCLQSNDKNELKKLSQAYYEVGNSIYYEIKNNIDTNIIEKGQRYEKELGCGISGFNEYKVNVMLFVYLHSIELILKALQIHCEIKYNNNEHNIYKLAIEINEKCKRDILKKELLNKIKILSKYNSRQFCYLENKNRELDYKDECVIIEKAKEIVDEVLEKLFRYV